MGTIGGGKGTQLHPAHQQLFLAVVTDSANAGISIATNITVIQTDSGKATGKQRHNRGFKAIVFIPGYQLISLPQQCAVGRRARCTRTVEKHDVVLQACLFNGLAGQFRPVHRILIMVSGCGLPGKQHRIKGQRFGKIMHPATAAAFAD